MTSLWVIADGASPTGLLLPLLAGSGARSTRGALNICICSPRAGTREQTTGPPAGNSNFDSNSPIRGFISLVSRLSVRRAKSEAMNFGAKSKDLLVELKRSDWLPPYNEDGVRGVLAEIQALYDELTDTLGGRTTVSTAWQDGNRLR